MQSTLFGGKHPPDCHAAGLKFSSPASFLFSKLMGTHLCYTLYVFQIFYLTSNSLNVNVSVLSKVSLTYMTVCNIVIKGS